MNSCMCGHGRESHRLRGDGGCAVCYCPAFVEVVAAPDVGELSGCAEGEGVLTEFPGAPMTADEKEHWAYLVRAWDVYRERERERGGGWKRGGVKAATLNIYAKAERAFYQVMRGEQPNPDHLIDLINYAAFALRLGADMNGKWPWPDEEGK